MKLKKKMFFFYFLWFLILIIQNKQYGENKEMN